jgi:hypothetical protein
MDQPRIISASRRTDIPAYYSEWFMRRVDEGYVKWRNPFGGWETTTSLAPDRVAAIVFWSKNYAPMLPYLPVLYDRGYRFIFHFTITGLPTVFEPRVPPAEVTIRVARELAERFGPDTVLWRYDPVLISTITDSDYHRARFAQLASALEGATRSCYFSFPTFYGKTIRNTAALERETGIGCLDLPIADKIALSRDFAQIAARHGIMMKACCSDALITEGIAKAHCVDADLLFRLYPEKMVNAAARPSRKGCGCYESTDIGAYDTCPHGCVYCYANTNKEVAEKSWKGHQPSMERL